MRPSFAHFSGTQHARFCGLVIAFALSACASTPPPTNELAAAQQAVSRAENADADQYAAAELAAARNALGAAQAAMARGDDDEARVLADSAAADGDLALARSRAETTRAEIEQRRAEIASLRQRLQLDATAEPASALDWPAADLAQGFVVDCDKDDITARLVRMEAVPRHAQGVFGDLAQSNQAKDQRSSLQ